ncbi:MAG TPA: tetraacyldisaccharide 4'-kinase [Gemmatimonadales bacterium]|nr:tetraacyldisaccharide 4'-kinase [Gemmatimonadales bacterium]
MNGAKLVGWLWGASGLARLVRLPLLPLAGAYWVGMRVRTVRADAGGIAQLPLPAIAVGNLSVGGTGKTPLAAWIARYCAARGWRPGILLRGYGGDEPLVHRRLVPEAVVVANPDRVAGAMAARAAGARILVLDDAYQLLGVARDVNIAVVSAESTHGSPWPLPAGPWRERWGALARATVIVVTRKDSPAPVAAALAERLARRRPTAPVAIAALILERLEGMRSGAPRELAVLRGHDVVAAAGIAHPESFAAQLRAAGAQVQLLAYQDHHAYHTDDVRRLVRAAATGGYVVVTEKDAVKLRELWPADAREPLVAVLGVQWEANGRAVEQAVDGLLGPPRRR